MKKLLLILMLTVLFLPLALQAQLNELYLFSTGVDTTKWYTLTADSTVLKVGSGNDSYATPVTNIGFTFTFANEDYTQFSANSDGTVRLGSTVVGTSAYTTPFSTSYANTNAPKICGLGCDGYLPTTGYIAYQLFGEEGSRVLVIEIVTTTYSQRTSAPLFAFQVQLAEADNSMTLVYSPTAPETNPSVTYQLGACAGANDIVLFNVSNNTMSTYTAGTTNTNASGTWPDAGRYYTIAPDPESCYPISELTASNNTTNGVTISFHPREGQTSWTLTYSPVGDTNNVITTQLSDTINPITGLESNTLYEFHVSTNCSEDHSSSPRSITALTLPTDPATLPYHCDFEDENVNSEWTFYNANAANQWKIGSAVSQGGDQSLYISNDGQHNDYYYDSASVVWAIRDIYLDPSYDYYSVNFNYKSEGEQATDYLGVYIGHSPQYVEGNNTGTFTAPSNSVHYTSNNSGYYGQSPDWCNFNAILDSTWRGSTARLYFVWRNDVTNGMNPPAAIDNLHVTGHTCTRPYGVHKYDSIPNTLTLTWSDSSNASGYEVALLNYFGQDPEAAAVTTQDMSYTFTDVETNIGKYFYIRSICGDEKSGWSSYILGASCAPISELPYIETFDSYGIGTTKHPTCWFDTSNYTSSSSSYLYISNTKRASGVGSLYFYATSSYFAYAVLPEIDVNTLTISNLMLSLKALIATSGYGRFEVGVMTNPHDLSSFTPIKSFTNNDYSNINIWHNFDIYFDQYTGEGSYIAIRVPAGTTSHVYIDDVVLQEIPECTTPYGLTVSNITHESCKINWSNYMTADSYEVALLTPAGADMSTATITTVSSTHATLTELNENTKYLVYVRVACGSSDAPWVGPVSVQTKCLPATEIPYTENFDEFGSNTGAAYFPSCWTRHTTSTTNYPYINTSNHYNGTSSLYFYSTSTTYSMATTQALDLTQGDADNYLLTFKLKKTSSTYGRIDIGLMTDPDDNYTLTTLKSIYPDDLSNTSDWFDFNVIIPAQNELTYIAFIAPQGATNAVYLDEVKLDVANCSSPSNLDVSNITATSAMISWDAAPIGVEDYTLEYSISEEEDWNSVVTEETSYVLSNLAQGTEYDVRVIANCQQEGESDTLTLSFTTNACLVGGDLPIGEGTSTSTYLPSYSLYKHCYSQQLFTQEEIGGAKNLTSLSLEMVNLSQQRRFKFYLMHTSATSLSSAWINPENAVEVFNAAQTLTTGWNTFVFSTPFAYNGTDNLLLIAIDSNASYTSGNSWRSHSITGRARYNYQDASPYSISSLPTAAGTTSSLRNNVIFGVPCDSNVTCIAPNLYSHYADDQSITLSWAPGLDETTWELRYKADNENDWNAPIIVTSTTYTIDGLTASTSYSVQLRSNCGSDTSNWISFTEATSCETIELPFNEDFESATGTSYACFVDCWTRGTNYTSMYPYVVSTQYVSGEKSLYFYGTSAYYSYAATPRFADDVQMDSLQITFQARKASAAYFIEVGIMTDPNDYSTFQVIGSFSPTAINDWQKGEFNTSGYTGTGRYVALRIPKWISSYMFVDDIHIDYIPHCMHVDNIHATSITADSATITWTAGGSETEWLYVYGPSGTLNPNYLEDSDYEPISDNTLVLGNLTGNTPYDVLIKASCDYGETSTPELYSFRTACVAISADMLPYIENFDNWGVATTSSTTSPGPLPACWERVTNYTSPYPFCYSTYKYNGTSSLYYYSSSSYYQVAVCPEISEDLDITNLQLQFMCRTYNSSNTGSLIIGVMTSPTNYSSFVPVDTVTANSADWHKEYVLFNNYTGTGKYIALKFAPTTSTYTYFMLDNLILDVAPSCDNPTNLTLSTVTTSSATYTWEDDASEGSWQVLFVPDSITNPDFSAAELVSTNSFTANDLSANTPYTIYVRTVCSNGEGYSNWTLAHCLTMAAEPATLPYANVFDNEEENAAWGILNGNQSNKWYIGTPSGESNDVLFISNNGTAAGYTITSASYVWAYRDITFSDAPGFKLSFNWKGQGESTYDYLRVYLGAPAYVAAGNEAAPDGATDISGILNQKATWQHFETSLASEFANNTQRLYFLWRNDGSVGTQPGALIDSISITSMNCGIPYNLEVAELTDQEATINFTPATQSDNAWQYVLGTGNFVPSEDMSQTPETVQTPSIELEGLTSNTNYVLYVRTVCGGGDYSEWTSISFRTNCGFLTIPYTENFESYPTGSAADFIPCWDRFNTYSTTTNYPYVSSTTSSYAHSGSKYLYFYNSSTTYSVAVLPMVDVTINPVNSLQVSFWMRPGALTNKIVVGVMTTSNDFSTFVPVDTIANTAVALEYHEVPLNSYNGNGAFVALRMLNTGSTYTLYLDDVTLEEIPSCPRPTDLEATASTTSSITLAWQSMNASSWEIAYGAPGFNPDSTAATIVPASTNPFTVQNLNNSTTYQFYVRSLCSATDASPWSLPIYASTECDIASLPYTEDFEGYVGTTYSDAHGVTPLCWTTYGTSTSYGVPHITSSGSYHYVHSGSNCLVFTCNSAAPNQYAALPTFTQPLNTLKVNFWRAMENLSYGTLTVGYVTNLNDLAGSFVVVDTIPSLYQQTNGDTISVDFTGANIPANGNICFHWYHNSTFYSCCIDDINVTVAGDTTTPITTYTVTLNTADATMGTVSPNTPSTVEAGTSFTATANANDGYHFVAWTSNNATVSTANPYTFTVNADITLTATFEADSTPVEPCDVPANLHATNTDIHAVEIAWDPNANVSSWNIRYRVQDGSWNTATANTNSYTITGLTQNTTYEIQVQANCGNNNLSEWSSTLTVTTLIDGIVNYLESSVTLFPNPAKEYVDIRVDGELNVTNMEVFDVYGKLLNTVNVIDNPTRIYVSNLSNGMYFVRVTTDAGMVTKTFVKK